MKPLPLKAVVERLEHMTALDSLSGPIARAVSAVVPNGSSVKDALSGTWLGEPAHPPLTDVVIGSWTSSVILDLLGGSPAEPAADLLVGMGCLAAAPTALTGLTDFSDLWDGPQRVAVVHAAGNVTALLLFGMSWVARARGARGAGRLLSLLGLGVGTGSAYLCGHLSFHRGIGVNQTAFEEPTSEWTEVAEAQDVPEGKLVPARAGEVDVVLYRQGLRINALSDRCSHRGCRLHEGTVVDGAVRCPCHFSTFELEDGRIVSGPAIADQPAFEARIREGKVEVRPRG
jgi:nitrite reductase/ring-hydroxylating ferredoxin subunit